MCTQYCDIVFMKNIIFSAQEEAIEQARKGATQRHHTLNELSSEWLDDIPPLSK